jgi:hypothetical protein
MSVVATRFLGLELITAPSSPIPTIKFGSEAANILERAAINSDSEANLHPFSPDFLGQFNYSQTNSRGASL